MSNTYRVIAAKQDVETQSKSPYAAAQWFVEQFPSHRGTVEVVAPDRCYIFMVLDTGNVVKYEG